MFKESYQNKQYFDELMETFPGGLSIAIDSSCKTIIHNARAAEFFRVQPYASFSLSSSNPPAVVVLRDGVKLRPEAMPMQRSAWKREEVLGETLELIWEDGTHKIGVWNSKPLVDENGDVYCVLASVEDITPYVLLERKMLLNQNDLEQVVRDKMREISKALEDGAAMREELARLDRLNHVAQMAAGISHEVRNPITTVRGFLQLLRAKEQYGEDGSFFDLMIQELDRANDIISEYLSLTKVKESDLQPGNLKTVFDRLAPLLEANALMMGKQAVFNVVSTCDLMLNMKEIQQMLLNLVRNGLEATPLGGHVYIESFENETHGGFSVRDEGKGIPEHILDEVGKPFVTTKAKGTGMGLFICYDIAKRHQAAMDIQSSPQGTAIYVQFPKIKSSIRIERPLSKGSL